MKQSVMRMSYEKSARGMRYEQIAAAKETLENFWARKGAPSRKFPRERRRPTLGPRHSPRLLLRGCSSTTSRYLMLSGMGWRRVKMLRTFPRLPALWLEKLKLARVAMPS